MSKEREFVSFRVDDGIALLTKELIFTGDPISADEAKRIGLVERLAQKGESVAEAIKLAKRVMLRGPVAVLICCKGTPCKLPNESSIRNPKRVGNI